MSSGLFCGTGRDGRDPVGIGRAFQLHITHQASDQINMTGGNAHPRADIGQQRATGEEDIGHVGVAATGHIRPRRPDWGWLLLARSCLVRISHISAVPLTSLFSLMAVPSFSRITSEE